MPFDAGGSGGLEVNFLLKDEVVMEAVPEALGERDRQASLASIFEII
jgi:hypothetical protein